MTNWGTVHMQGRVGGEEVAIVTNWLQGQGYEITSMSRLVELAFSTLTDTIINNGGELVEEHNIGMVLAGIGKGRKPTSLKMGQREAGKNIGPTQEEVLMATRLFEQQSQGIRGVEQLKNPNLIDGEVVANEPDEGEFSDEALRRECKNEKESNTTND